MCHVVPCILAILGKCSPQTKDYGLQVFRCQVQKLFSICSDGYCYVCLTQYTVSLVETCAYLYYIYDIRFYIYINSVIQGCHGWKGYSQGHPQVKIPNILCGNMKTKHCPLSWHLTWNQMDLWFASILYNAMINLIQMYLVLWNVKLMLSWGRGSTVIIVYVSLMLQQPAVTSYTLH